MDGITPGVHTSGTRAIISLPFGNVARNITLKPPSLKYCTVGQMVSLGVACRQASAKAFASNRRSPSKSMAASELGRRRSMPSRISAIVVTASHSVHCRLSTDHCPLTYSSGLIPGLVFAVVP